MTGRNHQEVVDAELVPDGPSASVALVPVVARAEHRATSPLTRPDPSFIAQLIASAEHAPQTRLLRRGSYSDAQAAYGAPSGERRSVTRRTRQFV